jgi:predicted tellurium resistance membrane protein TerC
VPIIIWGSGIILKLIDKYPVIIYLGSALLGWIAGDMIQTDVFMASNFEMSNEYLFAVLGSLFVLIFSFLYKIIRK